MYGGVLQLLDGAVLLEAFGEVLGGLRIELILRQAASESRIVVSAAADSMIRGVRRRT